MQQNRILVEVSGVNINTRASRNILNSGVQENIGLTFGSSQQSQKVVDIGIEVYYQTVPGPGNAHFPLQLIGASVNPMINAGNLQPIPTIPCGPTSAVATVTEPGEQVIKIMPGVPILPFMANNGLRFQSINFMAPSTAATIGTVVVYADIVVRTE
jgi:hypothetical protein